MKEAQVFGDSLIVVIIYLFERSKVKTSSKNVKFAFIALLCAGWALGVLLIYFPELPGPSQLVRAIFSPISKKITP